MFKKKKGDGPALDYKQTFLIGFGFMACMLLWSIYNSYVPVIFKTQLTDIWARNNIDAFLSSHKWLAWVSIPLIVNAIMTIDNIFGVLFQPMFGKKSDRTKSKYGKRMPYILRGLPACAILFIMIPLTAKTVSGFEDKGISGWWGILIMMAIIIAFNFIMSTWRSPVVSLMPDYTPSSLQSDGNAVINITGGVGQLIGFVIGAIVSAIGFKEAINNKDYTAIFVGGAILCVCFMFVLFVYIRKHVDRDLSANYQKAEEAAGAESKQKIKIKNLGLSKSQQRSLWFCLFGLFFICNATEAIIPNFTNFAEDTLAIKPIYSTIMMAVFAVSLVAFAIPAGVLGRKWGRKKTICAGLIAVMIMFAIYITVAMIIPATMGITNTAQLKTQNPTLFKVQWALLWVALVFGGGAIAFVNINTLPIVLAMGGREYVGTFTGYYYTATFSAAITGPILCGLLIGLFKYTGADGAIHNNYNAMFLFCAIAFLVGLLFMLPVHHGESTGADDDEWIEKAVEEADD